MKNGFEMLGTSIPTFPVEFNRNALAMEFPEYRSFSAAASTRFAVAGDTALEPVSTLDTVAVDTPASAATAATVAADLAKGFAPYCDQCPARQVIDGHLVDIIPARAKFILISELLGGEQPQTPRRPRSLRDRAAAD
ncbi:hypothetical protein GCM10023147_18720 [Tsukamurella soli]|uniref:Uncharacterized protein n=1 Tax=Tsukamurella soli TaxID=644556 RepID=A0ABP8JHG9_9ACTN